MVDETTPLPVVPRRILVAGTSGSGKTRLAARIAVVTQIPHVEIDALFHGPGLDAEGHGLTYTRIAALLAERPALTVVRLNSHSAAQRWLCGPLAAAADTG